MAKKEQTKRSKKPTGVDKVVKVETLSLALNLEWKPDRKDCTVQSGEENKNNTEDAVEYSRPLSWKQWADIFGMSKAALRVIRDDAESIYHFRKPRKNARRWTLPKNELPAEYLEKYRGVITKKP